MINYRDAIQRPSADEQFINYALFKNGASDENTIRIDETRFLRLFKSNDRILFANVHTARPLKNNGHD